MYPQVLHAIHPSKGQISIPVDPERPSGHNPGRATKDILILEGVGPVFQGWHLVIFASWTIVSVAHEREVIDTRLTLLTLQT